MIDKKAKVPWIILVQKLFFKMLTESKVMQLKTELPSVNYIKLDSTNFNIKTVTVYFAECSKYGKCCQSKQKYNISGYICDIDGQFSLE